MSIYKPSGRRMSQSSIRNGVLSGFLYDTDAEAYLIAVETADNASLEYGVRQAITKFIIDCKTDGNWTAIKAACILCGARTLSGALVPLVGTSPTNNNFVSGDYSRTLGLLGNGTTKWLNSNRNNNADPQNSHHMATYISVAGGSDKVYIGAGAATNETGASNFGPTGSLLFTRSRNSGQQNAGTTQAGFICISREASGSYMFRNNQTTSTLTVASQTPANANIGVLAATNGAYPAPARIAYYSIGEAVTLSTLDSRVTTMMTSIQAALA